jgi:hypothetical protein
MSVLWFALGIYIIGIAIVLFIRPTIMFSASGWKEFGLANTANYTVFPFWMFSIAWAVVSYAVASLFTLTVASRVVSSAENDTNVNLNSIATPVSKVQADVNTSPASSPTLPGYYILQESSTGGPSKYIYYGSKPPTIDNV